MKLQYSKSAGCNYDYVCTVQYQCIVSKKILITTLAVVLDKKEKEEKNEKCSIQIVSTVKSTSVPIRVKQKNINIKINNFVS